METFEQFMVVVEKAIRDFCESREGILRKEALAIRSELQQLTKQLRQKELELHEEQRSKR